MLRQDSASFSKHLPPTFGETSGVDAAVAAADQTIATAATTKLEFQVLSALLSMSPKDASAEIKTREREYANSSKLIRHEHVHPALTKWRDEVVSKSTS